MTRLYLRSSVAAGHSSTKGDGLEKRLLQAAEAGDAAAQCNLGILYGNGVDDNGHGVEANRPQAVRWLLAAAEQGLPRAQAKLAEAYAEEPDTSDSHAIACGWFLLAEVGLRGIHLDRARSGYERIASHLTPAQIAKARCFARDWTPKRPKQAVDLGPPKNPKEGRAL
jgi:TPR repeat protein